MLRGAVAARIWPWRRPAPGRDDARLLGRAARCRRRGGRHRDLLHRAVRQRALPPHRRASAGRSCELARLLGYQVQPGLAPTADLAFTLDPSPGAPDRSRRSPRGPACRAAPIRASSRWSTRRSPTWWPARVERDPARVRANRIRPSPAPHSRSPARWPAVAGDGVLYRTGNTAPVAFGMRQLGQLVDAVPDLPRHPGSPGRTDVTLALWRSAVPAPPNDLLPALAARAGAVLGRGVAGGKTITAEDLDAQLLAGRRRWPTSPARSPAHGDPGRGAAVPPAARAVRQPGPARVVGRGHRSCWRWIAERGCRRMRTGLGEEASSCRGNRRRRRVRGRGGR